jgi:hypothetical protein
MLLLIFIFTLHIINNRLKFIRCYIISAVGEYLVDKDRVARADVMLNTLFGLADKGFSVETEVKLQWTTLEKILPIYGTCDAVAFGSDEYLCRHQLLHSTR